MGERIRELREGVLKMTQPQLATALGYKSKSGQGVVSEAERGKRALPESRLLVLAQMASVPVTYFMRPEVGGVVQNVEELERAEKLTAAKWMEALAGRLREEAIPPTPESVSDDEVAGRLPGNGPGEGMEDTGE